MPKTKPLLSAVLACALLVGCAKHQPDRVAPTGIPSADATPPPAALDARRLTGVGDGRGRSAGGNQSARSAPPQHAVPEATPAAGATPFPAGASTPTAVPTVVTAVPPPPPPPAAPQTVAVWVTVWNQYVVRSGDNPSTISARLRIPVSTLVKQNGITNPTRLRVGQVLRYAVQARQYKTLPAAPPANHAGQAAPPAPPPPSAPGSTSALAVQSYQVQPGDTLQVIADTLHATLDDLVRLNGIKNPNLLFAGQFLQVPGQAPSAAPAAPVVTNLGAKIIPDSEAVYSPSYADFDVDAFASRYGGYLVNYRQYVDGTLMTGPQIIELIASRFSIGPRVLLTILEMQSGWVTNPHPSLRQILYPMGFYNIYQTGLYDQAFWMAAWLGEGYYGTVDGSQTTFTFADTRRLAITPGLNPGTVAVENGLAQVLGYPAWLSAVGPNGFGATYRRFFGDPFAHAIEPLVPPDLVQPTLRLPWADGQTWSLTGGPHEGWAQGSPRAAVDFAPEDGGSCYPSAEWVIAAAPGRVVQSEHGRVIVNLSGTNFQGNGWSLEYMHMATTGRTQVGADLNTGDNIGHPSCEGGIAEADHLHLARLYNGQWIPAGTRLAPMVLSGWTVYQNADTYDGFMTRGPDERDSCDCHDDVQNGIVGDAGTEQVAIQ